MRRRALLVTVGTVTTAGCGWSQTDEPRDPDEIESTDDGSDGQAELASSEGGSGPIEADAEALLLRESDVESDGWSETDVQVSGTCITFARRGDSYSSSLESCAEVFADAETATTEYQDDLDRSLKVLSERLDVSPEIGDEAALFSEGERENRVGELVMRLLFRDSNAVGRLEFTQDAGMESGENVPDVGVPTVVGWGATMHGRWR
jgi:hypothetical protein